MSDPKRTSKLKCYYMTRNNPRLLLSPAKVEEAFDEPPILLYHDIMSDADMDVVKTMAALRLQRARTSSGDTADGEVTTYRTSQSAWLRAEEHSTLAALDQRFEDVTNLAASTAELFQVANYGLGGHYGPHYDFDAHNTTNMSTNGGRIATLLIYMSDVESGGATVFPLLGTRTVPRKGTGVLWYNLMRNGAGDMRTKHAACPVLIGNKWAVNKWFHEHAQEFRRPCSLDANE